MVFKSALNFISTHIIIYVNLDNATDRDRIRHMHATMPVLGHIPHIIF